MTAARLALVAGALAGVLKLVLIWSGRVDSMILCDDAFYYFTIARNLADGAGPTFDGLAPTNGFHPLWQFMLVPVWQMVSGLWEPIRVALSLTVLLDIVSGVLLYQLVRRNIPDAGVAALATVLWFWSPMTFFLGLRGMETSVSFVAILLVARQLAGGGSRWTQAVLTGLLVGLCGWARTDNLVTVGLAVAVAVQLGRPVIGGLIARLRWLSLAGVAALAVMLPWFIWNRLTFGTIWQVSGRVKYATRKLAGRLPDDWSSVEGFFEALGHALFAPIITPIQFLVAEEFNKDPFWLPIVSGIVLALGAALMIVAVRHVRSLTDRGWLLFPLSYVVLHTLLFGVVQRSYSTWYALPSLGFLGILVALAVRPALRAPRRHLLATVAGAGLVASLGFATVRFATEIEHTPRGPEEYFTPLLAEAIYTYPDGCRIGAWDAGALGYFSAKYPGLKVVNLDGLVNNVAFEAVQNDRYLNYLLETIDIYAQKPERTMMFLSPDDYRKFKDYLNR